MVWWVLFRAVPRQVWYGAAALVIAQLAGLDVFALATPVIEGIANWLTNQIAPEWTFW